MTDVRAQARRMLPRLSAAEARVAEAMLADPTLVIDLSITDLAKLCGTSLSTVARFAQSLGYSGYRPLRVAVARELTLEQAQQQRFGLESSTFAPDDGLPAIAAKVAAQHVESIERTAAGIDTQAIEDVVAALRRAPRVELLGHGASSLSAQEMQHRLARIGHPAVHYADPHLSLASAARCGSGAVVIAFSHSGATADTLRALLAARDAGAATAAVTGMPASALGAAADLTLTYHAPEPQPGLLHDDQSISLAAETGRIAQLTVIDIVCARLGQARAAD